MKNQLLILCFLFVGTLQACTNATPKNHADDSNPDTAVKTDTFKTTDVTQVDLMDEKFAGEAARASMIAIQMGEVMERKGYHPEVKKFALMLVKDHQKALDQLKEMSASEKFTLPPGLDKQLQDQVDTLSLSGGREIDHKYLTFILKAHAQDLKKFQEASSTLKSADLKAFTLRMIPAISGHLEAATKLKDLLNRQ